MSRTDKVRLPVPLGDNPDEIRRAFRALQGIITELKLRVGDFLLNETGVRVLNESGDPVIVS